MLPVYCLSASKSLPEFLKQSNGDLRKLRGSEEYRMRLQLLQDLEFRGSSHSIAVSEDQQYLLVSGSYSPEIRMFDVLNLSMKFKRGLDHEIVKADFLSEDYRKLAILCRNRVVDFHAQYGIHHRMRLPKFGRDMVFDKHGSTLYVCSSSSEVYRLDLMSGQFQTPWSSPTVESFKSEQDSGLSCCVMAPLGVPVMFAGSDCGSVDAWDARADSHAPVSTLHIPSEGVSKISVSADGMRLAVGSSVGVTRVFDVRKASSAVFEASHGSELPIVGLHFGRSVGNRSEVAESTLVSADNKSVNMYDTNWTEDGQTALVRAFVSSSDGAATNRALTFWPNSGLFFVCRDEPKVGVYYAPDLGPAPSWCSHLDTASGTEAEGLDAADVTKKDLTDHVFVTRAELLQIGAESLIGSALLKAHLHGFWMNKKLHDKLVHISDPFLYSKYKDGLVNSAMEAQMPSRQPGVNGGTFDEETDPRVNKSLKKRLMAKAGVATSDKKGVKQQKVASEVLADKRFKKLWKDADFALHTRPGRSEENGAGSDQEDDD